MNYTKPELNIEKFSFAENVTADLLSGTGNTPPPWFVDDGANEVNLGGEILNEVFSNIFGI